ncbi:hypothetical protein MG293_012021 [Ovis ammon polii]|uniref:Uncharacterized protein n=1 Tax=Ovis ammon polii TaxID=230172 RepID=A0AAD4Y8M6_OVIAM|nr:hypothetical protein MG293_012021 [Ovis ammon polii]
MMVWNTAGGQHAHRDAALVVMGCGHCTQMPSDPLCASFPSPGCCSLYPLGRLLSDRRKMDALEGGKSSQNLILEDIRGSGNGSFLERSAAHSSPGACAEFPDRGSCSMRIRHFRKTGKEPRILTAL